MLDKVCIPNSSYIASLRNTLVYLALHKGVKVASVKVLTLS